MATTLITGAASGIGRATALLAGERGHVVIALDLDAAAVEATASAARSAGASAAHAVEADVTDAAALAQALDGAFAAAGVPDGTVCCAGIDRGGPTHELPVDVFDRVLGTNLRGTFVTCQTVIRALLAAERRGAIVCISSVLATTATPGGSAAYCASKGGVAALVRSLAVEYAGHGIRVNALAPGATETPLMWAPVPPGEMDAMRATVNAEVPLGRLADPREQANAALWLLSDDAAYVTGASLAVDGGILARSALSV